LSSKHFLVTLLFIYFPLPTTATIFKTIQINIPPPIPTNYPSLHTPESPTAKQEMKKEKYRTTEAL
jgi:hypothetical protein